VLEAVLRIFRVFKVRESGNVEFWVSNLVIMASTIIGVYLAAQAGYKTAIEFEVARSERDGYYLRRALLDEVKDNLQVVDEWSAATEKTLRTRISADYFLPTDSWVSYWADKNGWSSSRITPEAIRLKTFIWETMKEQSITFQLPSELISGVRRFNDNMEANGADILKQDWKAGRAAKNIESEVKKMREQIVPLFEKDIAELRESLRQRSVQVR